MPVKKGTSGGPIKDVAWSGPRSNKIKIISNCTYHITEGDKKYHGVYKIGDVLEIDPDLKVLLEDKKISPFIEGQIIENKQGEYFDGSN